MSLRSKILSKLINHIADSTQSKGYRGFKYLHELNDFPCFCLHIETEARAWTDQRYGILKCTLRGYQYSDQLDDIEHYARAIEHSIQLFAKLKRNIDDARVISVRTDEGVLQPYGVVDMSLEILYRYLQPQELTADSSVTADTHYLIGETL